MTAYINRYTGPIKAVLSDLAGTTVDFGSCAPAGTFIELFQRHGVGVTNDEARGPMGIQKRDHIQALLQTPGVETQWRHVHGRAWTEEDLDALYQEFIPMQLEALPKYSRVISGVVETAAQLRRQGVKIGASTGYNQEMLNVVLEKAAEGGFLPDASICASDVPAGRPAPWMNLRLMEMLKVCPPAAVVCIGDTIADIEAGLNAGLWTVGVTRTGNMVGLLEEQWNLLAADEQEQLLEVAGQKLRAAGAHYAVDSFAMLPKVIAKIEAQLRQDERAVSRLLY
jgi:phosphonoacetaldehyde hydrolase